MVVVFKSMLGCMRQGERLGRHHHKGQEEPP